MIKEFERVECNRCGEEVHVGVVVGTLDSSRLKCTNCRAIESKESVEKLMSAIFKTRTKIQNKWVMFVFLEIAQQNSTKRQ